MVQVAILIAAVLVTMLLMGAAAMTSIRHRSQELEHISSQLDALTNSLKSPEQRRAEARVQRRIEDRKRVLLGIGAEY